MSNEDDIRLRIINPDETTHKGCRTAESVDTLSVKVDALERSASLMQLELNKQFAKVHIKNTCLTVAVALILYGLYEKGILSVIFGVC